MDSFLPEQTEEERIQSRPLPTPPTPVRAKKSKVSSAEAEAADLEADNDETLLVHSEKFHSLRSSMTLVDEPKEDHQVDETLADSLIESMHTCLDTLQSDDAATLHSCDNTLNNDGSDEEDDEMMAEMLPHDKDVEAASEATEQQ